MSKCNWRVTHFDVEDAAEHDSSVSVFQGLVVELPKVGDAECHLHLVYSVEDFRPKLNLRQRVLLHIVAQVLHTVPRHGNLETKQNVNWPSRLFLESARLTFISQ